MKTVESDSYLGVYLDEFINYEEGLGILADSGGRALSSIIGKVENVRLKR